MRILVDTHVLIWHLEGMADLPVRQREFIADPNNTIYVSAISIWEIAIKTSLGKLTLTKSIESIVSAIEASTGDFLALRPEHTVKIANLPFHHKDPFDRALIAQAMVEGLAVITADPAFQDYGVNLL